MMTDTPPSAVFPPFLPDKGTVGIVAPSCCAEREWLDSMQAMFMRRGYEVVIHEQCYLRDGTLAGSDAARAEAINDMFADSTIDAIFCARGGSGSILLLDRLDYELIRENPKPYVGFSDSTAIVNALASRAGMVAFHGPMGWNFSSAQYERATEDDLFAMLAEGRGPTRRVSFPQARLAREGKAEGHLVGGNMSLLQALIGTPYDWSGQDAILFIEDVEEPLYKLERTLAHMRLAGKFDGVRAVLVGEMVGILDDKPDLDPKEHTRYVYSFDELVLKHVPPDIPVAFNIPCGHGRHIATFPIGAKVQVQLTPSHSEMIVCL